MLPRGVSPPSKINPLLGLVPYTLSTQVRQPTTSITIRVGWLMKSDQYTDFGNTNLDNFL